MNYSTYINNFKNRKLPEELESLLRTRDDLDVFSAELRVAGIYFAFEEDSDDWLRNWLDYESQIVESVLGIATNGAGDLLAFWLYDERDLKDAPIVFVGHEGDVSVIANNFSEMLLLLIACFDLHPDSVPESLEDVSDPSEIDEITLAMVRDGFYPPNTIQHLKSRGEEIEKGRIEFIKMIGLQPPQYPRTLMQNAIQTHPDFQEWLDRQISIEQSNS